MFFGTDLKMALVFSSTSSFRDIYIYFGLFLSFDLEKLVKSRSSRAIYSYAVSEKNSMKCLI